MEGDLQALERPARLWCFNPRPRMEGDERLLQACYRLLVSIHALVWRATSAKMDTTGNWLFQSTPSYGGRPTLSIHLTFLILFQSTPSYGGRQTILAARPQIITFQSTPSYGGRLRGIYPVRDSNWFQSTPSYGGRHVLLQHAVPTIPFQSTPSYGGRRSQKKAKKKTAKFQSTPSYGGRLRRGYQNFRQSCFNPRPRMEGDVGAMPAHMCYVVSIHALVWRATLISPLSTPARRSFQSTPSYGGRRHAPRSPQSDGPVSIHALVWRATL